MLSHCAANSSAPTGTATASALPSPLLTFAQHESDGRSDGDHQRQRHTESVARMERCLDAMLMPPARVFDRDAWSLDVVAAAATGGATKPAAATARSTAPSTPTTSPGTTATTTPGART